MYLKYDSLLFFYAGSYGEEVKLIFQSTPVHCHVPCCVCGGLQKTCPWSYKHRFRNSLEAWKLPSFPEVFRPQTPYVCPHRECLPGHAGDGRGHIFTSTPHLSLKLSSHCWDQWPGEPAQEMSLLLISQEALGSGVRTPAQAHLWCALVSNRAQKRKKVPQLKISCKVEDPGRTLCISSASRWFLCC